MKIKSIKKELVMNNTKIIAKSKITDKAFIIMISVAFSVILPQIFHAIGAVSGAGASVGSMLLPMHVPVLFAGFVCGPVAGLVAGILSPVLSFAISGMPSAVLVPFMMAELSVYGFVAGKLSSAKTNAFFSLIITQFSGKIARAVMVIAAVYVLNSTCVSVDSIKAFMITGIPGMVLQWILFAVFSESIKEMRKKYE